MDNIVIRRTVSLDSLGKTEMLHGITFTGEAGAHTFEISCTRDGSAVNLTGNCTAYFLRSDNETIALGHKAQAGDPRRNYARIENGKALVTLHPDCYNVPGRFKLSIYASVNNDSMCVYSCVGVTERTTSETIVDSGAAIPNLNQLQNAVVNVNSAIANAEAATTAAEKVNIAQTKNGNVITVTTTDRNNVQTNKTITEPTATMSKAENGDYTITVTDANGSTSYTIEDTEAAVRKKATIEAVSRVKTALGNPLTLNDGMDAPAVKTVVTLEPKQDLHGYDHPWVGGSTYNLLPLPFPYERTETVSGTTITYKDGKFIINGTTDGTGDGLYIDLVTPIDFDPSKYKLYLKSNGETAGAYMLTRTANGETTHEINIRPANRMFSGWTYQAKDNVITSVGIRTVTGIATINNLVVEPMLLDINASIPDEFIPYSNICPIEGYDTVRVTATGKNLFDGVIEMGSVSDITGTNADSTSQIRCTNYIPVKPGVVYTMSRSAAESYMNMRLYDANKRYLGSSATEWLVPIDVSQRAQPMSGGKHSATFAFKDPVAYIRFQDRTTDLTIKYQLEFGYEATEYEPYQASSNTTSLSVAQAAGATVYGGTVSLNEDGSGTLVVDRVKVVITEATSGLQYDTNNRLYIPATAMLGIKGATSSNDLADATSNQFACVTTNGTYSNTMEGFAVAPSGACYLYSSKFASIDAWKTHLQANNLEIEGALTTPTTYTLTASQLRTLTGENHVWTDGTKLELTYRADKYADVEKFLNAIPTGTKTGDPAVFKDGADDLPFEKLTIAVEPHQEGSGDPSPDNIRPITGWDEVKVTRCGKNLFPGIIAKRTLDDTTGEETSTTSNSITTYIPAVYNTVYVLTPATGTATGAVRIFEYDKNLSFLGCSQVPGFTDNRLIINPANANTRYIRLRAGSAVLVPDVAYQLEKGSNPTAYEPYTSTTLPISLKYATGSTVYGGTVTINRDGTGSVVVDRAYLSMSGFQYESGATRFWYANVPTPYGATVSRTGSFVCDKYIAVTDGRAISGVTTGMCYFGAQKSNGNCDFYVHDTRYTDATTFNAAVSPVSIAYKLATPTTYTLTAPQLTSLLGNNTVWCDAGQVTVKYKRDIGKALDAMVASLIEAGLYVDMGGVDVVPGA